MSDLMMSAIHAPGFTMCGIAPRTRMTTTADHPCWNCQSARVAQRFSGSGWYEDDFMCADCGEDVGSGYRPFKRAWRKANIAIAEEWLAVAIELDEYRRIRNELTREEMGWDEPGTTS